MLLVKHGDQSIECRFDSVCGEDRYFLCLLLLNIQSFKVHGLSFWVQGTKKNSPGVKTCRPRLDLHPPLSARGWGTGRSL